MSQKLTINDGKKALADHVRERARMIRDKYGPEIRYEDLTTMLEDPDVARFPVKICYDSALVPESTFGKVNAVSESENPSDGYVIVLHEYFQSQLWHLPALVLYQLVAVNYGDFATCQEAEIFGSTAMGMSQEDYYHLLCQLTDGIPA